MGAGMKTIYIIRAFDAKTLKYFTPSVGAFLSKTRAEEVCDEINKDPSVRAGIEPTRLNEEDVNDS